MASSSSSSLILNLPRTRQLSQFSKPHTPRAIKPRFLSNIVSCNCDYNPSRRLAIIQLGAAIPQSQLFRLNDSAFARAEDNVSNAIAFEIEPFGRLSMSEQNSVEWVNNDKRRMLHAVYNVGDLDKTIKFYTECLGMKLLRKRDIPEERYSNAFLGFGSEESHFSVELTYSYGVDKYEIGSGFGHFGIAVNDAANTVDQVKSKGGRVRKDPGQDQDGTQTVAFVDDPDGYGFKLFETGLTDEPFRQVMLRVGDLDRAVNFYKKAFGMKLLRKRDYPEFKYATAAMGYGPEDKGTVVELTCNYGVTNYDKGNGYVQIAIGTNDVYKTAEVIKQCGGEIAREPGPLPVINTKITICLDPDGWKWVFVDNADFLKELQ